jgi:hypothetical protein
MPFNILAKECLQTFLQKGVREKERAADWQNRKICNTADLS